MNDDVNDGFSDGASNIETPKPQKPTEFVRLNGQPWHGDSAECIKLCSRFGNSVDGPNMYSDRVSRTELVKRDEYIAFFAPAIQRLGKIYQCSPEEIVKAIIFAGISTKQNEGDGAVERTEHFARQGRV